jgi:hypothetical protein
MCAMKAIGSPPIAEPRFRRTWMPWAAGFIWVVAVTAGFTGLLSYQLRPGVSGSAPTDWPAHTRLKRSTTLPTMLVFAHPKCPCTRATMAELDRLMLACRGKVQTSVVFFDAGGNDGTWAKTDLWRYAANIPGVVPLADHNGVEAERFDVSTSGDVLLYDRDGKLVFHGGITGARSHEGDNPGRSAICEYLQTGKISYARTPAFGCAIRAGRK